MKKLILLLLMIVCAVLVYFNFNRHLPNTLSNILNQNTETTVSTEATETTIETETTEATTTLSQEEISSLSLFNEVVPENSQYGRASIPEQLANLDIYTAINAHYTENYSEDEKKANQIAVSHDELQNLQTTLQNIDGLEEIDFTVDQVTMTLDNQTVYIPRIIFPISYENANRILQDNDLKVLTEAMTQLGNRLVMIAYYEPNTQSLIVYHLTNWTNPLFTYTTD